MTAPRPTRPRRTERAPRRGRGRPKDLGKRQAILAAASRLFLAHGFAETSMDAVAAAAGVSKITVYAHFASKESLFQAIVRARCETYNRPARFAAYVDLPPRRALAEIGRNFLALLLHPEVLRLYRVIGAEAARRPKVARLFHEAGPERGLELVADYFRRAAARGHFTLDDPERAADEFLALLKGRLHFRATLNLRPRPSREQIEAHVQRSVAMILRAYTPAR